jgi:C4-dicarboxylate-specific signal transduction histidine kinase
VATLLTEHENELAEFMTRDQRGKQVIGYLKTLAGHLAEEQSLAVRELRELGRNIDHIKEIVAMQQSYARVVGVVEDLSVAGLVEDALQMHAAALARHQVRIIKNFNEALDIQVDKHKTMQIVINLISNAKYALAQASVPEKVLTLTVNRSALGAVMAVQDNGIGIPAGNLTRIFSHGFTTKAEGHGFGLHAGALAAREMGGSLSVHSDGPERGATFTLELPLRPPRTHETRATAASAPAPNASTAAARPAARPAEVNV